MTDFKEKPRSYYKSELAHLYCPDQALNTALKSLREWIEHHPTLLEELKQTGYRARNKRFTPLQVELIFKRIGEP